MIRARLVALVLLVFAAFDMCLLCGCIGYANTLDHVPSITWTVMVVLGLQVVYFVLFAALMWRRE